LACLCLFISSVNASATDREWENPVYETVDQAVSAARSKAPDVRQGGPRALRFFVDLTLAAGDVAGTHPSASISRMKVEDFLITHPTAFVHNDPQRRTIERFTEEVPRQAEILEGRLARFGYPETPGLVYLRLVDSVDAFSDLSGASSDKMTQVGGVTYYCRYIVLPLSYVGEHNVRELRRSAALNQSINVEDTIRRWQRESFANLTSTFRHELVHVRTNSTLDVPIYSDRVAYPTWFHEGTATYLAADPSSGLSRSYQEFQRLFFFLAQRYGVKRLQQFYTKIFGGSDVRTALAEVYSIADADALFARSARWYHVKETVKTALWIAALAIVIAAFRGADRPYFGGLQVLVSLALLLAAATGIAEHLYGLKGPEVVTAVKIGIVGLAIYFGFRGIRRIRRHRPVVLKEGSHTR
jgi:hypothetical protein